MTLQLQDFDYSLPERLIAQVPLPERDAGRLMRIDRATGSIAHHRISDLPALLPPQSLVIVNDTRVIPARLFARRSTGGRVELLLLERIAESRWACMVKASKSLRRGEALVLEMRPAVDGGRTPGAVVVATEVCDGRCEVELDDSSAVERHGTMPLPPYIRRPVDAVDAERYQTIFARDDGSIAAPTAGLHFSDKLTHELDEAGALVRAITLHVGPGTFTPVRCSDLSEHRMESERYAVPPETAAAISLAKTRHRKVVAVGTTVVRALEASRGQAGLDRTDLFIVPGYRFAVVDALMTNLHLPRSTLLMLVCAFGGLDLVLEAYAEAVAHDYRFYSYGDAMLIV